MVPDDREGEEEAEAPVPRGVEDEARGDDERAPALRAWLEQPRERQHEHEEDREGGGREEHASRSAAEAGRLLRLRWRQPRRGPVVRRRRRAWCPRRSSRTTTGRRAGRAAATALRTRARARASTRAPRPTRRPRRGAMRRPSRPRSPAASRSAAAASTATAMRKRISSRSHGTASPRARGESTERTQLGLSRTTGRPSSQPGRSPSLRREGACLVPQRVHLGLEPFDLRRERADGADELPAPAASGSRETCVVSDGSATVAGSALVGRLHLVERGTALLVHLGASVVDRRPPGRAPSSTAPRRATRRASACSSSAGSTAAGGRRRRRQLGFGLASLAPAQEGADPECDERDLDELAHGAMVPPPPEARLVPSRSFLPRPGSVRSRRRLRAARPTQTEGRRTGT